MSRLARHCAVVLTFLTPLSLSAADRQNTSCYRLDLKDSPRWITSGATWDKENERLLMVDPLSDQIVSYNLLGERETISNLSPDLQPVKIARANDGFLVELVDGSMLSLDRRLAVTGRNPAAKRFPVKASLFQWAAAALDNFTVFAALPHEDSTPTEYGFFHAQGTSGLQPLLPADGRQKDFFLLGHPYIASTAGETFFLSMAKHPALYRVSNGKAEELKHALPRRYQTRPDFKTVMTGPSSAPAHYAELETFSIPAGLYAQDGYLYLLTREPAAEGKTTWWLYQIDPTGSGNVLGRAQLPTSAHHLTIVPTSDRGWMIIEKGRVEYNPTQHSQTQKVGPLVVISNAAIRSLSIAASCPLGGGMLFANQLHTRALFVPEGLLASGMAVPVELSSQKNFDLRRSGEPSNVPPCDFLESPRGQGSSPNASDLKTLVTSSRIAVVGKIVSTEPGWDARLRRVTTKVHLKIERSLKGNLKAGREINFLSPGGSMIVADKPICTSPRKGFYQPRVGDEVVVSAEPSGGDSRLLESPYVFPLSEGKVIQPEPYPALLPEQKPVSLSKLLSSLISSAL